jgi:uncharacterized membrane protein YraQ (UPF0718 family)
MAIFLSARVLGFDIGVARVIGSVSFAVIIGVCMSVLFRRSEAQRTRITLAMPEPPRSPRALWQTCAFFAAMLLFLVFSDWYNTNDVTLQLRDGRTVTANVRTTTRDVLDYQAYDAQMQLLPDVQRIAKADVVSMEPVPSTVMTIYGIKWPLAGLCGLAVLLMLWRWFTRDEVKQWLHATWDFALMIVPLLFGGVFVTGFIGALIPESYVAGLVGGNAWTSNLAASVIGALWYFATLTEIPITETLMKLGMGRGPALALLLAGPALSLPSILVIYKIVGFRRTAAFVGMVVVFSSIAGWVFGAVV